MSMLTINQDNSDSFDGYGSRTAPRKQWCTGTRLIVAGASIMAIILVSIVIALAASKAATTKSGPRFTMFFVGDTNLRPDLATAQPGNFSFPWGDLLPLMRSHDLTLANHEGTIADNLTAPHRDGAIFQDPYNWTETFVTAGIDFLSFGNNHQFDFYEQGVQNTLRALRRWSHALSYAGLGTSEQIKKPVIFERDGARIAVFSLVAQVCLRGDCSSKGMRTCGGTQCFPPNDATGTPGLWFVNPVTEESTKEVTDVIQKFQRSTEAADFVIASVHCGPEFPEDPLEDTAPRVQLYHALVNAGVDIVWGHGPATLQPISFYKGRLIIYGPGQYIFPRYPGIKEGACPKYAEPCWQYRPDLAVGIHVDVELARHEDDDHGGHTVAFHAVHLHPLRHTTWQAARANHTDEQLIFEKMARLSRRYGAKVTFLDAPVNGARMRVEPQE